MPGVKKVYIKTYGCQMNVYDSERMVEALSPAGYVETDAPDEADVIVLNTCHIREKAAEKVYSELGRLSQLKNDRQIKGRNTLIAVAGCVAQAEGEEIIRRAPIVDLVVGPQSYHRLPEFLSETRLSARKLVQIEFPEDDKFQHLPKRSSLAPVRASAFLTIQEGCDKFCTFCVVPYTRGIEISRPVEDVVSEARELVAQGVREITLLGQNVNAYHGRGPDGLQWNLAKLAEILSELDGLERIRYTTSHPRDMSEDLIRAHATNPKLMPYLHLPFQAGSDRVLAAMNRKHTSADYLRLIDRIRAARPDIAMSTDIIVGFPGESDAEFERTMDVVRDVKFAQAYSFKYSARPGTPAANLAGQLDEAVKSERLLRVQELLNAQQTEFNAKCVGQTVPVLFERKGRGTGQLIGRSPYLQSVHVDADDRLIGEILPVKLLSAGPNSLSGELLNRDRSGLAYAESAEAEL